MNKLYNVMYYNPNDVDFGYDPGPVTVMEEVDLATAKSIVRHHTKGAKEFPHYYWYESTDGSYNSHYDTLHHYFYGASKTKEEQNETHNSN
jgi:hypothetical protein